MPIFEQQIGNKQESLAENRLPKVKGLSSNPPRNRLLTFAKDQASEVCSLLDERK